MTDPRAMASPDDRRPIRARAGESPDRIDLPIWVDACIALDAPRSGPAKFAVYPVARALMASRVAARGDEAVQLNRSKLARWAGISRADNASWILKFLQRIGFIEIHSSWSPNGRACDVFDVFTAPPANYIGPMTYAELDMAIEAQDKGQPVALFDSGLRRSEPTPENAGVAERDTLRTQGLRRSEPTPENAGVALNKEASLLRNRSEAKRDAARFAGADAVAPEEDPLTTEVHDLVRRLPWERTKLGRLPNVMREAYEDLVPAIAAVVREGRLTLDEARNIALTKIREGRVKSVRYLVGAFDPERLSLPTPDDVLDLPSDPQPAAQQGESGPEQRTERESPARRPQPEDPPAPRVRAPEWVRRQNRELRRQARARRVPSKPAGEID